MRELNSARTFVVYCACVDGGAASLDDPPEVPPVACFECDLNQSRNFGRIDPDPKEGLVAHHPFDARNESARVHATGCPLQNHSALGVSRVFCGFGWQVAPVVCLAPRAGSVRSHRDWSPLGRERDMMAIQHSAARDQSRLEAIELLHRLLAERLDRDVRTST